jgi:hypothetical protein
MTDTALNELPVAPVETASPQSQLELAHAKIADLENQLKALKDHVGGISGGMAPAVEMTSSSPVTTEEGMAAGDAAQQLMNEANPTMHSEPTPEPFSPPVVTEEVHQETSSIGPSMVSEPAPSTMSSLGAPLEAPSTATTDTLNSPVGSSNLASTTEMSAPMPSIPAEAPVQQLAPAPVDAAPPVASITQEMPPVTASISTPEVTMPSQPQETAPVASVVPTVTEAPKTMPFEPSAEKPVEEKKGGGLLGMLGITLKRVDEPKTEAAPVVEDRPTVQDFLSQQTTDTDMSGNVGQSQETTAVASPTITSVTAPEAPAPITQPTMNMSAEPVPAPAPLASEALVGSAAPAELAPSGSAAPVDAQYAQATSPLPVQPYAQPQYNPYASLAVNPNPDETLVNY